MAEREGAWSSSDVDEGSGHLRVTRRGFIAGGVASAFVADKVFGAEITNPKDRWVYSRSEDGADRFIYQLTYFDGAGRPKQEFYFRELSFGVVARIDVRPTGAVDETAGRVDLRLRISHATMLPEGLAELDQDEHRFFTLDFVVRHNVTAQTFAPDFRVEAQGWIFGEKKPAVLASRDLESWIKSGRKPVRLETAGDSNGLATKFKDSVFGSIVDAARIELLVLPQMKPGDQFLWRIATVAEKAGAAATALTLSSVRPADLTGPGKPGGGRAMPQQSTVARAPELDIWRDTQPRAEPTKKAGQADVKKTEGKETESNETEKKEELGWVEGNFPDRKPAGSIIRGAFRGAAVGGSRLLAAAHRFPDDVSHGIVAVVLDDYTLALPDASKNEESKGDERGEVHAAVEFARWSTVIDATGDATEAVAARVMLSGDLSIASVAQLEPPGPEFLEGQLPFERGELCLSTALSEANAISPRWGNLDLLCRLPLAERTFTLATSLGVYSAERPELKKQLPGDKRTHGPIVIRATNFTTISHFEAAVRIADASVALLDDRATVAQLGAPRGHFSRLDFLGGPEIALRLHGIDQPTILHPGHILLGTTSGLPLPQAPEPPASSLPMDRALLRVLRYGDLADLRFRFAGLDLINDGTKSVLRPRGPAVVARIGDPLPDPELADEIVVVSEEAEAAAAKVKKAGDPGKTEAEPLALPLTGAVHDPRPMIIVEFPPQHRAEQAFFQLRTVRPSLPKLPTPARETRLIGQALRDLHAIYAPGSEASRLKLRADILFFLIREVIPQAKDQSDDQWKLGWRDTWKTLAALLKRSAVPAGTLDLGGDDKLQRQITDFLAFADTFAGLFPMPGSTPVDDINTPPPNFPLEQKLYAGPEFVDPDTLRYAELAQMSLQQAAITNGPDGNPILDNVPANPVSTSELEALKANLVGAVGNPEEDAKTQAKALRELRSPGYTAFSEKYDATIAGVVAFPPGYKQTGKLAAFAGGDELRGLVVDIYRDLVKTEDEAKKEDAKKAFAEWWAKEMVARLAEALKVLPAADTGAEVPMRPVQSRLSGPTRLAFRINTEDYDPKFATGEIPFTVDALTDFSRFELSVVRRAQKLLLSHLDGSRRPAWDTEIDQDFAHMLVHQGFSQGGGKLEPVDVQGDPDLADPASARRWSEARVTVDQRLAEVVKLSSEPPTDLETAIEMPFRLMLSPSQDALFRTPRGVPAKLFPPSVHDQDDYSTPGPTALWTAELDPESGAETRAIWSPDYRSEAFLPQEPRREGLWNKFASSATPALPEFITRHFPKQRSRVNRAPLRGPYAPWVIGRHLSSLNLSEAKGELDCHRFRTSLDAFDRHELVALSSVHGLPVLGRVSLSGKRIGRDQREPPRGFQVSLLGKPANREEQYDLGDIYVPRPLDPQGFELALSALGGFLSVNASFEPPASIIDYERGTLFDALSIERWRHRIVLGRDISAEVVYKGYLMPFGIRASLIKSTERRFERIDGKGGPVAVLRQRMFIRIAKPVKDFGAFRQSDEGRRVPFRKVRVVTLQTPDIVDPFDLAGTRDETGVWPGGLIDLIERPKAADEAKPKDAQPGTPFWPRTARRSGAEVMFEVLLDDKIRVRMPMVFVDNVTVNRAESLQPLTHYYNLHGTPPETQPDPSFAPYVARAALVQRPLFSQKLIYAPPENDGDTEFETETLTFAVEGGRIDARNINPAQYQPLSVNSNFNNDAFLNGADQPPFYPAMRRAVVHVKQIERLTGQPNQPVTVGYDTTYALSGFDPPPSAVREDKPAAKPNNERDIFLALLKPLPMRFGNEGQRGGAVARPQIDVVALSRSRGPIGDGDAIAKFAQQPTVPSSAKDQLGGLPQLPEIPPAAENVKGNDLSKFFGGNAKLLGIVKISDLLKALLLLLGLEPKLREIREFGGGLADDADAFIRDRVLTPVRNALTAFSMRLRNLTFNGVSGTDALERVYPEVSRSMADFIAVLDEAISAAPPSGDADASIELYSSVYSTGRRFTQAIERVTRDPLTPLREAVRGLVEDFIASLKGAVGEALDALVATYKSDVIRKWVIKTLQQQLLVPNGATSALANVIIRLPVPADETVTDRAAKHVDEAYAATLLMNPDEETGGQNSPWSAKSDRPIFDLETFRDTFFAKLTAGVENDLKAWVDSEKAALVGHLDRLQGALWVQFDDIVVAGLSKATAALENISLLAVDKAVEALEDVGVAFAKGFDELTKLQTIAAAYDSKCLEFIGVVDAYVQVAFPRVVVDPRVCIGDAAERDWTKCNAAASYPPFYRLVGAVARLAEALAVLAETNAGKLKTLIEKVEKKAPIEVAPTLAPLKAFYEQISTPDAPLRKTVADVSAGLLTIAQNMQALRQRYEAARQSAATLCKEPVKLVRSLLDVVAQLEKQRTAAIGELVELSSALRRGLSGTLLKDVGVSGVTKPSNTSVLPALDAKPESWAWSDVPESDLSDADSARYFIETAKKDIIATVVRPAVLSAAALADATILGALVAINGGQQAFDQARDQARAQMLQALTNLDDKIKSLFASLTGALAKQNDPAFTKLIDLTAKVGTAIDKLVKVDAAVVVFADEKAGSGAIDASKEDLLAFLASFKDLEAEVVSVVIQKAAAQADQALEGIERQALDMLSRLFAGAKLDIGTLLSALQPTLSSVVKTTATAFQTVLDKRNAVIKGLPAGSTSVNAGLTTLLVACPPDPAKMLDDQLAMQTAELTEWGNAIAAKPIDNGKFMQATDEFLGRVRKWKEASSGDAAACTVNVADGPNAIVVIFKQITEAVETVIRGQFGQLIDIGAVRREVEAKLREMVPTRLTLAYDFDVELKNNFAEIFIPNFQDTDDPLVVENYNSEFADCRLTLKARTYIDLLKPAPPKVDVSGSLGAFRIKLVGTMLDVVTLQFDGARFGSDTGGKLKTNITDFKLGEMVAFLDSISQWVSFGDSGFFLSLRYDLPGIEAGYRMPPIYLTLGALNISNVSLNASCVLPFSEGDAIFKVGLSRPEAPFSITSTIFGGCGHLALYANSGGIIGFSASLEFGAIVDFKLGPVTGRGQITAGIYIRSLEVEGKRVSTIEGVFTAAGSAKIAMFSIMAMLQVRVGQQASGGVAGSAIFVFSFSLGIKDIEFRFVIAKQEKKGFGGGGISASLDSPTRFAGLGLDPMTTGATTGMPVLGDTRPKISSVTSCKSEHFADYMQYFSEEQPWILSF
ncbi:hypothetical protein NKI79_11460 [Mesorhizobium sp. M0340]|uniref:hypothetical protein n=1 Tax=Mesorhizobium sp. M0340 TaxID=2956939 RepID=UPI003339F7E5